MRGVSGVERNADDRRYDRCSVALMHPDEGLTHPVDVELPVLLVNDGKVEVWAGDSCERPR